MFQLARVNRTLFMLSHLNVPCHVGGNHWVLAVVTFMQNRISVFDSLERPTTQQPSARSIAQTITAVCHHFYR